MELVKVNVRGVDIANVTMNEAAAFLEEKLARGKSCAVYTPNAEIVQQCIIDDSFRDVINRGELVVPDGIGVVKAAKILGTPLKEKVAGIDLGYRVFEIAEKYGYGVYFLGGAEGVAEKAAERMKEKYKNLTVCGCHHGYFAKEGSENDEVIGKINASGAKIVYVCLSFPTQEKWIDANRNRLPQAKLFMALGGSLDGYSGNVKRAPAIFIRLGLEWFYRLVCQPQRIFRMMSLPRFYFGTWVYKFKRK